MKEEAKYRIKLLEYPFPYINELDWIKDSHVGLELTAWETFSKGPDDCGPVYMVYTSDYYQALQKNHPRVIDYFRQEEKLFGDIADLGGCTSYGIPVKSCELVEKLA
ncbi:MAG: hypothetical protein AAB388_00345 [Patescibacteria group bacterium]